jgi:hypothetical protein
VHLDPGDPHRCRALISRGKDAERYFQAALAIDGLRALPHVLARTEPLYGEWLRRARRRADARPHLRTAQENFERLGATPGPSEPGPGYEQAVRPPADATRSSRPGARQSLAAQPASPTRSGGERWRSPRLPGS